MSAANQAEAPPFLRLLCVLILIAGLLASAGCGKSDVQIGLGAGINASFSSATVLTGETVDITAVVTGTSNKSVVWSVCNGSGTNCVVGGSAVRGTIVPIGTDAQGNSIARYTAPATVPSPPECQAETSGCSVVLQGFLTAFNVSCFARVTVEPSTNPVPTITSLVPPSAIVGGPAFTLTVNGTGFIPSSIVRWDGSDRATTFISSTVLEAAIPAADIAETGTADITVFNPPPDGGLSNTAVFGINNPTPALTLLTPASAVEGDPAFTLTVTGSGFIPDSVVHWNGSPRTTAFETSTEVTADIPASDIAAAGTAMVTVVNPGPGGGTSNALPFTVNPVIPCTVGVTQKVSVATDGTPGDMQSDNPRLSADGRYATFFSLATNLVANDTNGTADVFRRDTCLGAGGGCTPSTERVSLANDGSEGMLMFGFVGNLHSTTPDARFVAFDSNYPNLVAGDGNGVQDVFLRDTCLGAGGCTPSTIRASVSTAGVEGNGSSQNPSVSADGRYVAFDSSANNLVPSDGNGITDVFVRDTCIGAGGGCTPSTVRVSVDSSGNEGVNPGGAGSAFPVISPDGRFVAFGSGATNLVPGDTNGTFDIFVHDRDTDNDGIFDEAGAISTERVSVASDGSENTGAAGIFPTRPAVTPDFRFLAFFAGISTLVPGDTATLDVFVRDTCRGAVGCTPSTVRVSVADNGAAGDGNSLDPDISADGRFVVFRSVATNFVTGASGAQIYVHDRDTDEDGIFDEAGAIANILVSTDTGGMQGNVASVRPVFNANASLVAFTSDSTNFVVGDTSTFDVFLTQSCVAPPPVGGNPVPAITSLVPSSAIVGSPAFTLTVNGSGFIASSLVRWDGSDRTTTFISDTVLEAAIPDTDIAATGTANVTVFNPGPGGGESNMAVFNINNPAPMLELLTPSTAVAGGAGFTLTVDGSGFVGSSEVQWNGSPRTTTFVSSGQVTADIPASDIAAAGSAMVTVVNPGPGGGTSNALTFTINPAVMCSPGVLERVSLTDAGGEGNGSSTFRAPMGAGRRFVAFESDASNLVTGDTNGDPDNFVRDTCVGGPMGCTPATVRVSVASDGTQSNPTLGIGGPEISADGRFIAFDSDASDLVTGDTNNASDVFLHDRDTDGDGLFDETGQISTTRVSVSTAGAEGTLNFPSSFPAITPDGRFVVFRHDSDALVPGDTNGFNDVFVRDTCFGAPMGCTVSTVRVSVAGDGTQGNASGMFHSAISADGRYVAFSSGASTLVAGDTNGFNDIFVHDRDADNDGIFDETGAGERATVRVSVDSSGAQANGISSSLNGLGMSADGRFVAFQSGASNLAPGDTNATNDIFVHDRDADNDGIFDETGAGERATLRVSVDSGGAQGNGASANTTISANGRFVSFNSAASNLVTGDTNGVTDAFVRDTCLGAVGCTPSTVRVSVAGDGTQGNTFGHAFQPVISLDGSFVTFSSDSTNLIAGDTNGQADVFLAQTCFGLP